MDCPERFLAGEPRLHVSFGETCYEHKSLCLYYTLPAPKLSDLNSTGGASVWNRRHFIAVCSSAGLAGTLLPGVLYTMAQGKPAITKEMIDAAAQIADVNILDEYKQTLLNG